jgi:predicted HicB family RNase H-like nuclease
MSSMTYKGYTARIEFDEGDGLFWGKVLGLPASGELMLRVAPEVHSAVLIAAQAHGISLNQWASRALQEAAWA